MNKIITTIVLLMIVISSIGIATASPLVAGLDLTTYSSSGYNYIKAIATTNGDGKISFVVDGDDRFIDLSMVSGTNTKTSRDWMGTIDSSGKTVPFTIGSTHSICVFDKNNIEDKVCNSIKIPEGSPSLKINSVDIKLLESGYIQVDIFYKGAGHLGAGVDGTTEWNGYVSSTSGTYERISLIPRPPGEYDVCGYELNNHNTEVCDIIIVPAIPTPTPSPTPTPTPTPTPEPTPEPTPVPTPVPTPEPGTGHRSSDGGGSSGVTGVEFSGGSSMDGIHLFFKTTPQNAKVFINKQYLGLTDTFRKGLPPGRYQIDILKEGCINFTKNINLDNGESETIDILLECELKKNETVVSMAGLPPAEPPQPKITEVQTVATPTTTQIAPNTTWFYVATLVGLIVAAIGLKYLPRKSMSDNSASMSYSENDYVVEKSTSEKVLEKVKSGLSNDQIAQDLKVTIRSVERHLKSLREQGSI